MVFNLGDKNVCRKCKLVPISGGDPIELKLVQFRKSSVAKIADIMKSEVRRDNQSLVVDSIICSKDDYNKLPKKRYKATFEGLSDIGNNYVIAIEFVLGNIEISFDIRNVTFNGDNVLIHLAEITAYPFGDYYFDEIKD